MGLRWRQWNELYYMMFFERLVGSFALNMALLWTWMLLGGFWFRFSIDSSRVCTVCLKKKNVLFYVVFLQTGTHSQLQSKEPKYSQTKLSRTHARTHACTHARTHARTHTHTHTPNFRARAHTHTHTHTRARAQNQYLTRRSKLNNTWDTQNWHSRKRDGPG